MQRSAASFVSLLVRHTALSLLLGTGAFLTLPAARAQQAATLTILYSFPNDGSVQGAYTGPGPQSLLFGKDGSIYGTTAQGGSEYYGSVFKLTSAGQPVTIYSFTGDSDGGIPDPTLAQDDDGNFYGITSQNGANNNGTVFKVSPTGSFTLLHTFTKQEGFLPRGGVVRGADGAFYGVTGSGLLYRVTSAGDYTLSSGISYTLDGDLLLGQDGYLYSTGHNVGGVRDAVVRISPGGAASAVGPYTLGSSDPITLTQGRDGNFYGTTAGDGFNGNGGTVFQVTAGGVYTLLHRFDDPYVSIITSNSKLLAGSDGSLYGAASEGTTTYDGTSERKDLLYQITPGGVFSTLYTFHGQDGASPQVSGNVNPVPGAALLAGTDGSFYGTTAQGGTDNDGTIFKATLRPGFFAGAVTLDNGVYYLALPDGNIFGYFSFLSDPNYLYHQDMGYEYVFNANDGKSGVYLYDFKSSSFFYTSPTFPFPYLYDFTLNTVLYYYPDPDNAGRYNTNGMRYFYRFDTGQIITK